MESEQELDNNDPMDPDLIMDNTIRQDQDNLIEAGCTYSLAVLLKRLNC